MNACSVSSPHVPGLVSVVSTTELSRRPSRPPDYPAENRALVALTRELATSPDSILQKLAETALALCRAQSAGLSLLVDDKKCFRWNAIAGQWASHLGGGTPRDFGPCGTVLDLDVPLLFCHPERDFNYLSEVQPCIDEGLLIPFHINGEAIGTIWVISHDASVRFDAEDLRMMTNLGDFASTAYQTVLSLERRLEEEKLRESEQNLRLIIETIPDLVWCATPDGVVDLVNQRFVNYSGKATDGPPNNGWLSVLHSDDVDRILKLWNGAVATGEPYEAEFRYRRHDGVYRWFRSRALPLRDRDGKIVRWCGLLSDIDDQKNAEEALRNTELRLSRAARIATAGEMAASIAHEINQPLMSVVASAQACLRWLTVEPSSPERARKAAERVIRDGNDVGDVVRRIRALFQRATPERTPVNINEVIGEVLALLQTEIVRRCVSIETDLEPDIRLLTGDRVQLQQVVFNLVLNGLEAMEATSAGARKLFIRSHQEDDALLVEVRDYGVGLKNPDKIFEVFFTTKDNGMGMGLTICRSIIEAHSGQLWSAAVDGPGAMFCFRLPAQSVPQE